jgi:SAM-dependent methyltransferase
MEDNMPNIKKLWIIGGIGASGKTTFANLISKNLDIPCYRVDDVYCIMRDKLNISSDELSLLPLPETWENPSVVKTKNLDTYKTIDECAKISYLEFFNYKLPNQLILESCSLVWNERELKVVIDIFKEYDVTYFFTRVDYEQWLKNRSKRVGDHNKHIPPFLEEKDYYEYLDKYIKKYPKSPYEITDIYKQSDCSLTGGINYQNEDFSEPKWEVFNFPDLKDKSFLDISCNTGWFLKKAKESGANKIYGLDISWQVLEKAKEKVPESELFLSKVEDFDFLSLRKVDYILCSSAFHYYHNRENIIKRISEITSYFILETPVSNIIDIIYQGGEDNEFCSIVGKDLILKWLKRYFKDVEEIGQTETPNGLPRPVFKCTK